jgi:two-component system, NtrC family, nitrogen regulation sensor histidine kinase NtrY
MSEPQQEALSGSGRLTHAGKVILLSLSGGLAATLIATFYLWTGDLPRGVALGVTLLLAGSWLGCAWAVRARVVRPLQTISNLLLALREEDFSIRANILNRNDPLGEVLHEINALSDTLRDQRLGALEAGALLRAVMEEISVAVFAFDQEQRLKLANRAGEQLLGKTVERMLKRTAAELGLAQCLEGPPVRTLQGAFAGSMGRWAMRRSTFRQHGQPHQLLVLADLSHALREEERQAWQRLLRVLGHELNNSLAPIRSISGSLGQMMAREPLPSDWRQDMTEGLAVISGRAEALSRFMADYSKLARLPAPKLQPVQIGPLLNRVVGLEHRLKVALIVGPELTIPADPDQIEHALINLVRNAVDAASETKGQVSCSWSKAGAQVEVRVEDEGPGLSNTANLFVPFFTTKPTGSGIGLALSRQIAEAHGGSLTLENRSGHPGCIARLLLPLGADRSVGMVPA